MGFLDWLTGKIECPRCGTGGAKEINGQIHCTNPTCACFSKTMGKKDPIQRPAAMTFTQSGGMTVDTSAVPAIDVPAGSIAIHYRNFRGQQKTFVAEAASVRRKRNHISVKVGEGTRMVVGRDVLTGEPRKVRKERRIVLSRDRILNLAEVENSCSQQIGPGQDWPTPRERQVLNYHKKRRSTSPLYENIRAKYPNW